jgi:hypothetical protein
MEVTLQRLVSQLEDPEMESCKVIGWGSPVPSFGDISRATVATLGLNPSNREFVDRHGNELDGSSRRFPTLGSLGLRRWSEARRSHHAVIAESCRAYFFRNPYDGWFRQLDHVIGGTAASYYDNECQACHLDLIPFATACKWTDLSRYERERLVEIAGDTLAQLLLDSPVRIVVLNGRSVVEELQRLAAAPFESREMPGWTLKRNGKACIAGISYKGVLSRLAGVELERKILVLGYNHNLQSSFGVTNEVRDSIRRWITKEAREFLK